ncbi:GspE/PulE family protein, partial [Candidatus Poribacteria bacterium]
VAQILPEDVVRRFNILPIRIENDELHVIATEPLNLPGMDQVKLMTGLRLRPTIVSQRELSRAIGEQFSSGQASKQAIIDMTFQEMEIAQRADQVAPEELDEAPVVDLVRSIIHEAISDKASDIHLEPQYMEMQVRYRINGLLHDITVVPTKIQPAVVARIKLLADMDITENRRSQDGHISVTFSGRRIDLRISTVLTVNGEKMVIRVLDKESMFIDLGHLGMMDEQQEIFRSFISQPYGMILVTGPTGSGKSTTLYAALQELDSFTKNIVTVENPVEYQMTRINQIQVNPHIEMTFATALRTIVRQDPDIIMVGEIRDFETADIAVNAALTGHLVFSTVHTNDAPSTVVRLLDMGIEPFLTSSAVIGVVAQRLVRTICPECKESYSPSHDEVELLDLTDDSVKLARGKGCDLCQNTGYGGRAGIFEIFEVDEDIRRLILAKSPASEIKKAALAKGMKSLGEMGREKVLQGISTTEEVRRVIYTGKE